MGSCRQRPSRRKSRQSRQKTEISRRLNFCGFTQTEFLSRNLPHAEFLDFAGHGKRKAVHEFDVFGNLVGRNFADAKFLDVIRAEPGVLSQLDPGHNLLAVLYIRNANYLHLADAGTSKQKFLYFARVDVLSAADDYIFGATRDLEIAIGVHGGQIATV